MIMLENIKSRFPLKLGLKKDIWKVIRVPVRAATENFGNHTWSRLGPQRIK
jgi:hypothetical protein